MLQRSDRIFPLCELLLGAAYADRDFQAVEKTEIRALLIELAGEVRIEVEACIASFEPEKFKPSSVIGIFKDDTEEERQRLLLLVSTVIETDGQIDVAESDYLREVASLLGLPESALDGLVLDVEIEEVKETFAAVRKGPPPLPARGTPPR
jgi:tellurite resistance protein